MCLHVLSLVTHIDLNRDRPVTAEEELGGTRVCSRAPGKIQTRAACKVARTPEGLETEAATRGGALRVGRRPCEEGGWVNEEALPVPVSGGSKECLVASTPAEAVMSHPGDPRHQGRVQGPRGKLGVQRRAGILKAGAMSQLEGSS